MYVTSGAASGSSSGVMPGFDGPRIKETLEATNADVRNVYVGVNWNWEFSSSWMLTSHVTAAHQFDSDKNSLWLGKRNYVTVYSGFAYRF
jgi:outer membrane scaffolding protein for murein synthesis (MipA/OmpV family)